MKRIREDQRTKKIQQWKIEQKAEKFLELVAKSLDKTLDAAYDEVGYELMDKFGDIYGAFEIAAEEGVDSLLNEDIKQTFPNALACEMEGAAFAQVAYAFNKPLVAMRAISDNGDGSASEDFDVFVKKVGAKAAELITNYVEKMN